MITPIINLLFLGKLSNSQNRAAILHSEINCKNLLTVAIQKIGLHLSLTFL